MMAPMLASPLAAIRAARPDLRLFPRAIVEAVLLSEGSIGSTESVARCLGLLNRFQLARLLKQERVPTLHQVGAWATILSWVVAAERDGTSLCYLAFRAHRHPSACYRFVKEITGLRWEQVRARGSTWVERRFLKAFHLPPRAPSSSVARDVDPTAQPTSCDRAPLIRYGLVDQGTVDNAAADEE